MKNLLNTVFMSIFFIGISSSQDELKIAEFEKLCNSNGLQFKMPDGYKVADVKTNGDLNYSFAVINADSSMEIRYTIWSLKPAIEEYEKSLKDENSIMIPPNNIYKGRIQANVLNMTGGKMYNIGAFPPLAVQEEFNANNGGSCFLEFNSEFGKGYKYGQFIYLHKDDKADAIVTFMSNNKETHADLMMVGFHSLTFK
ncbi:hypothetical protein [Brumimicrobium mesophilum]|uniref:hypothetical protein n=1 Tax=Brumimicrobium mesophilum TaxID=392717 RepID=UPI000D141DA5|nr:hypothetical protein [Brumimicrobium mesophilum]